jgi:hypothetical protein
MEPLAWAIDDIPLQDRDLLLRLNQYFDTLEMRLRLGEGWMIFNAGASRTNRISQFLHHRLQSLPPMWTWSFIPWRDFSLTAYMVEVELPAINPAADTDDELARREYDIAQKISRRTMTTTVTSDLLIVSGLHPEHPHEVQYFEETIEKRCQQRLATIMITPDEPHEFAEGVSRHAGDGEESWRRIAERIYQTNLIAM